MRYEDELLKRKRSMYDTNGKPNPAMDYLNLTQFQIDTVMIYFKPIFNSKITNWRQFGCEYQIKIQSNNFLTFRFYHYTCVVPRYIAG